MNNKNQEVSLQQTSSSEAAPKQEKHGTNEGDSIPSLTNQNRDIGVPINAIPATNSASSQSKIESASLLSKEDANRISNAPVVNEPLNLPELGKADDFKSRFEHPMDRADDWSSDNLHMAKSIDLAQGNINGNFETSRDKPGTGFCGKNAWVFRQDYHFGFQAAVIMPK